MTLFPEMCETVLSESIIGRARENGYVEINCINIRDYTQDKHRRVDDAPYGGGMGGSGIGFNAIYVGEQTDVTHEVRKHGDSDYAEKITVNGTVIPDTSFVDGRYSLPSSTSANIYCPSETNISSL